MIAKSYRGALFTADFSWVAKQPKLFNVAYQTIFDTHHYFSYESRKLPSEPRKETFISKKKVPRMSISKLSDRALERIFILGIERVWRSTAIVKKEEDEQVDDLDVHLAGSYLQPVRHPFQRNSDLLQLMNCAQVCKRWFELATSPNVWGKLQGQPCFQNSVRELDPVLLGKKWNSMFVLVDVVLECNDDIAEEIVKKIELAARANRARFILSAPITDPSQRSVHGAWRTYRPHLQNHAERIQIHGFPPLRGLSYYHFLCDGPWKNLQELTVDQCYWAVFPEDVYDACVKWWESVKTGRAVAPFPALKKWTLTIRPNEYPAAGIVHMAPNLQELELNIEQSEKRQLEAMEKIAVVVNAFLATRQYRSYVTLTLVRVVRKPGPSDICKDKSWLQILSLHEEPQYRVVTVSEVDEEGYVFEGRLPLSEFANIEDAADIVLEKCGQHIAEIPDSEDGYSSESFLELQNCLRQLIP